MRKFGITLRMILSLYTIMDWFILAVAGYLIVTHADYGDIGILLLMTVIVYPRWRGRRTERNNAEVH